MKDYTTYLITGGSGFLGRALAKRLKGEVRIFSRDESLQEKMKEEYPHCKYILGDVRDYDSIRNAVRGAEVVIHAAAVKYLDWAEEQPTDCVKTNILGSMNVIKACLEEGVKACVACSTDKAPYTRSVYGASKLIMEALLKEANQYNKTKFCYVRYGNVVGSTGSIIPKWIRAVKQGEPLYVTGKKMRRFFMSADDAVDTIFEAIRQEKNMIQVGMKAINMWRLAEIISEGKVPVYETEPRSGERLYEVLRADYEGEEYSTNNAPEFSDEEIKQLIYEGIIKKTD